MTDFPPPSDSSPSNPAPSNAAPSASPSPFFPPPASVPPGYVAHQSGFSPSSGSAPTGNWVGAIFAAVGMQIGAVVVSVITVTILFVAAFSTFGDRTGESPAWTLVALPVGLAAVALYIGSGYVAARIARDGKGWLMLIIGPFIIGTVLTLLGSIASLFG